MNFKKLALAVTALTAVSVVSAIAAEQDVDVEAQFQQAISLVQNNQMDFTTGTNVIEYTGIPAAGDHITLATNGDITVAGTAFSAPATGQAGDVGITGSNGSDVEVSCEVNATISDGTNTLTVDQMEIVMDIGVAAGIGTSCAGLGTSPLVHTLDGTDIVLVGGRIDGNTGTVTDATYNTTNAGGDPVTVRVVYQ